MPRPSKKKKKSADNLKKARNTVATKIEDSLRSSIPSSRGSLSTASHRSSKRKKSGKKKKKTKHSNNSNTNDNRNARDNAADLVKIECALKVVHLYDNLHFIIYMLSKYPDLQAFEQNKNLLLHILGRLYVMTDLAHITQALQDNSVDNIPRILDTISAWLTLLDDAELEDHERVSMIEIEQNHRILYEAEMDTHAADSPDRQKQRQLEDFNGQLLNIQSTALTWELLEDDEISQLTPVPPSISLEPRSHVVRNAVLNFDSEPTNLNNSELEVEISDAEGMVVNEENLTEVAADTDTNVENYHFLDHNNVEPLYIGACTLCCQACKALHFFDEKTDNSAFPFKTCCEHGQVQLPKLDILPPVLRELFNGNDPESEDFFRNIHQINIRLSMATFESTTRLTPERMASTVVTVGGTLMHYFNVPAQLNTLPDNHLPRPGQFFFYDSSYKEQLTNIRATQAGVSSSLMGRITDAIARVNPLMQEFFRVGEILRAERAKAEAENSPEYVVILREQLPPEGVDPLTARRFDPQQATFEVAVLTEGLEDMDNSPQTTIIQITNRQKEKIRVSSCHAYLLSLLFPLFFPRGTRNWHPRIPLKEVPGRPTRQRFLNVSRRMYYAYMLHHRHLQSNNLHRGRKLFQYFVCNGWLGVEGDRMWYIRSHQREIYTGTRKGLHDYLQHLANRQNAEIGYGKMILLPHTFEQSPACMYRRYLNSMALVKRYGIPDLFITGTCNPQWKEIQENLMPGQKYYDRPELVARVYYLRFKRLKALIESGSVFGPVVAVECSFEFQKRGLPHVHMIIWLHRQFKMRSPPVIDKHVKATIPDKTLHKELYDLVVKHMLHNLCGNQYHGAPCMKNGRCSKAYPKTYRDETVLKDELGRVGYRRPNDGSTYIGAAKKLYTNRNVVPYNPALLKFFQAHVNVDVVTTHASLSYIFKYLFKGSDAMNVEAAAVQTDDQPIPNGMSSGRNPATSAFVETYGVVDPQEGTSSSANNIVNVATRLPDNLEDMAPDFVVDENGVAQRYIPRRAQVYLDHHSTFWKMKYTAAMEGAWRLLGFPLHYSDHHVLQLDLHDEYEEMYFFRRGEEELVLQKVAKSTFLAVMKLYSDPVLGAEASQYKYEQIPEFYRYHKGPCTWTKRLRRLRVVGRLIRITPGNLPIYFLYLLVINISGYGSFVELRTVRGVVYETYREACQVWGLLKNDDEHARVIRITLTIGTPRQARRLFAHMLPHCGVLDPQALFESVCDEISADYAKRNPETARFRAMRQIAFYLRRMEHRPDGWTDMLQLIDERPTLALEADIVAEDEAELNSRAEEVANLAATLNAEQRTFFDLIVHLVTRYMRPDTTLPDNNLFYLAGEAGTGKTYLYRALYQYLTGLGKKVKCVSWTGISALLLPRGTTCHYTFGLPMSLHPTATCKVPLESVKAKVLRECHMIIWDEISMAHKEALRMLDALLKQIMNNDLPFGGKLLIVSGDFRQLLPVVNFVSANQTSTYSPTYSNMWPLFQRHALVVNQRAAIDPEFSEWLQNIGSGTHDRVVGCAPETIRIPDQLLVPKHELILSVFGEDVLANGDNRAILTPTNAEALRLNEEIITLLPGDGTELLSEDTVVDIPETEVPNVPIVTINGLTPSGLPPHRLFVKQGTVVMLIRNLDVASGLANGTRLKVLNCFHHLVLQLQILCGERKGDIIHVPRMEFMCKTTETPAPFKRFQFPLRPAYAITVNKSQGQTLDRVGLYLPRPCFSHGQLYVGLSRVATFTNIVVCLPNMYEDLRGNFKVTPQQVKHVTTHTLSIVSKDVLVKAQRLRQLDVQAVMQNVKDYIRGQ